MTEEILRIAMLIATFYYIAYRLAKNAKHSTYDRFGMLNRKLKHYEKPHWNGQKWEDFYYYRAIAVMVILLVIWIRAAFVPFLALFLVVLTVLLGIDGEMITAFQATVTAIYDNHRHGKVVKLKHLHISVYPRAFIWVIPATVLGIILLFMFDVLIILLCAKSI